MYTKHFGIEIVKIILLIENLELKHLLDLIVT